MNSQRDLSAVLLLAVSVGALAVVYAVLVPRGIAAGDASETVRYVVGGWIPFTLACYALGRLFSSPEALPSMQTADAGLGLFLVSFLLSLGLDAWGFSPERLPEAHALQAVGIFVGLALFGWGIGRRSKAIAQYVRSD